MSDLNNVNNRLPFPVKSKTTETPINPTNPRPGTPVEGEEITVPKTASHIVQDPPRLAQAPVPAPPIIRSEPIKMSPVLSQKSGSSSSEASHSIPEVAAVPFGYVSPRKTEPETTQTDYYTTPRVHGAKKNKPDEQRAEELQEHHALTGAHRAWWKTLTTILGILVGIAVLVVVGLYSNHLGFTGTLIASVAAIIPFAVIVVTLWWVGRYHPTPWALQIGAFFWGMALSILATLGISALSDRIFGRANDLFTVVAIQAPIIEEFSKGLGLVLIMIFFKKRIMGPIDGLVIMSLAALGFAFTENIQYLAGAYASSGGGLEGLVALGFTWVARAVLSPFAHIMFSSVMGLIVGWGIIKGYNRWTLVALCASMWPIATGLHALWNGSNVLGGTDWGVFYVLVEIPLFVAIVAYVFWLRQNEITATYKRIHGFAEQGWFKTYEVDALATMEGRQRLKRWANKQSEEIKPIVSHLLQQIIELSYLHRRLVSTKNEDKQNQLAKEETLLLYSIKKNKELLTNE